MKRIVLIDNYDSFTFNLFHYLKRAGADVYVVRNNEPKLEHLLKLYKNVVISPGPSSPKNAGKTPALMKIYHSHHHILGVCLGMQILNEIFGGKTAHAPEPVHGKTSCITVNTDDPLFHGIPSRINVARYHSLICADLPSCFEIIGGDVDLPMAIHHQTLPVWGVQFHPESFLTEYGFEIIQNFVALCH